MEAITKVDVINPLITQRWSPRDFEERPIEKEKIDHLIEAARWAPSSYNIQPWRFICVRKENPESFNKVLDGLLEGNQGWAKAASAFIVTVTQINQPKNGMPNPYAWHDVGLATSNILLQATELGIYAHLMGGYKPEKLKSNLRIPEGYVPVAVMALGYLREGSPGNAPENQNRQRFPLDKIRFIDEWQDY